MSDYMVQESSGPLAVRYRKIVMWIHWITALLLIMQVYIGFVFHDMPKGSEERAFVFGWHKTLGALILLLALTRLAVRLEHPFMTGALIGRPGPSDPSYGFFSLLKRGQR